MPTLNWNSSTWDGAYDWTQRGEEWSSVWGGSVPQWFGSIHPRIGRFLPAEQVLEIAPGFGRWTKFLVPASRSFTGVDLSRECIDHCSKEFAGPRVRFFQNDGRSLSMVPGRTIDFAFSFDSLVHVELDVLEAYVSQLVEKLTPKGVAFLHHSNFKACGATHANDHFRAETVSAGAVAESIRRHGGRVLIQELINWGCPSLTDCLTLFSTTADRTQAPRHIVLENPLFMQEANSVSRFHAPYWRLQLE